MDIVKQCEIAETGKKLSYFDGMISASNRYGISPLTQDYKNMRNDIVHEGVLSGSNFVGKDKAECAAVISSALNWIDAYVCAILKVDTSIQIAPRWNSSMLEHGLPALSL
ncbi:MAG: hypothetical protein J0I15_16585 [Herbaspirillum huttiense]|uniref:hypothetical protein n=1 Tax=Herbaspirillum huttiense TaxID=863372 RepID=UPI001AC24841|nr:hypothetical protein [Herbaspirillum huttiense]MBN9358069.1 hypothetical protein [Herbaspirillum huttiense]